MLGYLFLTFAIAYIGAMNAIMQTKGDDFMRNWKDKLTSRKLWLAIAGFVTMLIIYCTGDTEKAERVSALIMAGATVIGYMLSEGLTDAAHTEDKENKE